MNDPFLPEELRLFIACELPGDWIESLREASRALSRGGLGYLRWVRPEGIHLTLKFLGEAGRHLLPDIEAAIRMACRGQKPFELNLTSLGSFGGRRGARVLWAGVGGDMVALTALQGRVDRELSEIGFARELRPFSPHLTLARVPDTAPADAGTQIVTALRSATLPPAEPLRVREVELIRSQLGAGGAVYTRLTGAELA